MRFRILIPVLLAQALMLAACVSEPDITAADKRKAAETNTALGRQYMDRGQYEVAMEKLKRAIGYDKSYAPAHTMMAILLETIGETDQAGDEYRKAVEYDRKDGDVNNNYGAYLCGLGRYDEAEPYFQAAVRDPFYTTPAVALANAGSCALSAGHLDKAETFLRESLEDDPKLGAALLPMADLNYQKKEYLKARAFLQRYEAVGPKTRESLSLGYNIESMMGDTKAAEAYRSELQKTFPGAMKAGGNAGREQQ